MNSIDGNIRLAHVHDLESIVSIYNYAVASGFETADLQPWAVSEKISWLDEHNAAEYPIFVFETTSRQVVGWISLSPYRKGRLALRHTAEVSYYIHPDYKRMGIGTRLMQHTLTQAIALDFQTLFAIVIDQNRKSIAFLERLGFSRWGHLPLVVDYYGIRCGHYYYGLHL